MMNSDEHVCAMDSQHICLNNELKYETLTSTNEIEGFKTKMRLYIN